MAHMVFEIAMPVLYMTHCLVNADHSLGLLPALIEGGFSLRVGPDACWGCAIGGGCAVWACKVIDVARTVLRDSGSS